jgi:hypothetical protein
MVDRDDGTTEGARRTAVAQLIIAEQKALIEASTARTARTARGASVNFVALSIRTRDARDTDCLGLTLDQRRSYRHRKPRKA